MAGAGASVPRRPNLLTPACSATYVAALAQHAGQSGGGRPELWSAWAGREVEAQLRELNVATVARVNLHKW